jgi:hypothetical protein
MQDDYSRMTREQAKRQIEYDYLQLLNEGMDPVEADAEINVKWETIKHLMGWK